MNPNADPLPRRHAFTLVELLVTVAVVAVLMSLTLPSLGRAVDRAESVTCVGNLRQWGLATALYAAEGGDFLPWDGAPNGISTTRAWYADLPPLLGIRPYHEEGAWRTNAAAPLGNPAWFCPSNPRRSNGHLLFHYCVNRGLNGHGDRTEPTRIGSVPEPSRTVWMFDNGGRAAAATRSNLHRSVHGDGANVLFVDGSVRRVPHRPVTDAGPSGADTLVWTP